MLTVHELPKDLERDYNMLKGMGRSIAHVLETHGTRTVLKANVNLYTFAKDHVVFILNGFLKLTVKEKLLRLYSDDDIVLPGENGDMVLSSEYLTDIALFDGKAVIRALGDNPELLEKWIAFQNLENKVNLRLLSTHIEDRPKLDLELRPFKPGETIIMEGSEPTEIYELISGSASVYLNEQEIGSVSSGEIFGEMSFLRSSPRTATVKAESTCCVRVVKKDDFFTLIETDAHLSASIAKTLSKRIVEANRQATAN